MNLLLFWSKLFQTFFNVTIPLEENRGWNIYWIIDNPIFPTEYGNNMIQG